MIKAFADLRRFLDENNFPEAENVSVTITVNTSAAQAAMIDGMLGGAITVAINTRIHAETQKRLKVASGSAYGIPFKIERRT